MSLTRQYHVNPDKVAKGVPMPIGKPDANGKTPVFIVARATGSNPNYKATQDRIFAPHNAAFRGRAVPPALFDELTRKVFAEAGIVGWSNVLGTDVFGPAWKPQGFPRNADASPEENAAASVSEQYVSYTREAAESLLKRLPELYDVLAEMAVSRDLFGDDEADAGN